MATYAEYFQNLENIATDAAEVIRSYFPDTENKPGPLYWHGRACDVPAWIARRAARGLRLTQFTVTAASQDDVTIAFW